jgi:cell wall-associated NlpC family hydrolase
MAFRLARPSHEGPKPPTRNRLRIVGVATVLVSVAVTVPTVASAAPNRPIAPRIQSVQQRLSSLSRQNDQIVEKYNQADNAYHAKKAAAAKAAASFRAAQHRLITAEQQLSQSAAAQYEGGTYSATGALLSSDSGSNYLDQLDTLSMLSQHNSQVVSSFAAIQKQAKLAKTNAENLYTQAQQTRAALGRQHTTTQRQIAKFTKLLASLNAQQRALWAARQGAAISRGAATAMTANAVHASSAQAQAAVRFALDQVGKPYVWGAAGPDAYDCSGLTMAAWQQGGVSLPHSAADQYNYGHHVSFDQLQPGDLMFFYQPIGHVTIYIGNGMMVSAPEPGEDVKVVAAAAFGSDFVGATRLVG